MGVTSLSTQLANFECDQLGSVLGVARLERRLVLGDLVHNSFRRVGGDGE